MADVTGMRLSPRRTQTQGFTTVATLETIVAPSRTKQKNHPRATNLLQGQISLGDTTGYWRYFM